MAEGDLPDALPPERAHVPCIISCPRDFPPLSEVFPPPLGHDCLARLFLRLFRQIGEKAEMDIGRLKVSDGRAQVTEQRAQRRCGRRIGEFAPLHAGRQRQAQQQAARTVEKGHDGYRVTVSRKVEWPDGRTLTDSFRSEYKAVPDVIIHGNPSVQPDKTARKQMTGTNVKQETEGTQKEKQKTVS